MSLSTVNNIIRLVVVISLIGWKIYWELMARKVYKDKPKTKKSSPILFVEKYAMSVLGTVLLIQLLGLKIFPTPFGLNGQLTGLIMVLVGILITVHARIVLDSNWSHAAEYQIKQKHKLVSRGVYGYIRHPIYLGITVVGVGAQLVAESYLFIPTLLVMFTWSYIQGRREETLLKDHFGKPYEKYMSKTKMLVPFVI